jgi:hypothetical protein
MAQPLRTPYPENATIQELKQVSRIKGRLMEIASIFSKVFAISKGLRQPSTDMTGHVTLSLIYSGYFNKDPSLNGANKITPMQLS